METHEFTVVATGLDPAAPLIGDLLARNLDWPGADEVARRLARANGGG